MGPRFSLLKCRQHLFVAVFLLFREENGPTGIDYLRAFGLKFYRGTEALHGGDLFDANRIEGGDELGGNGAVNDLFRGPEISGHNSRGNDGIQRLF